MSNEESDPAADQVTVNEHSAPEQEKICPTSSEKDGPTAPTSKELHVQGRDHEDAKKERALNETSEVATNTGSNKEEAVAEEVTEEISSHIVEKEEEVYKGTKENRSNEESEAGEKPERGFESKEKREERKYGTAPSSPSQAGRFAGYGQGYLPMYGHALYSQYGYPHYPQPPYYPGGYHPHYSMPPPHVMPPQQYPQESEQNTGSPGRRYHTPPYYPYPPASPVLSPPSGNQPYYPAYGQGPELSEGEHKEGHESDLVSDDISMGASRIKIYVKQSGQALEEVIARRSRKNAQSRARAAKHREYVAMIEAKDPSERTPEEQQVFETHQTRRKRKNDRSRERALEKKLEVDKILTKPEVSRTKIEKQFLEASMGAKKRKNEGDRLRRRRLKELGFGSKGLGKPGISARGPMPSKYAAEMAHAKQMEPQLQVGAYGMSPLPPHGYAPMLPPPNGDTPHSPGGGVY